MPRAEPADVVAPRRVGRPRADASAVVPGDPREQILEAAAGLFTTVGYARTTTRAVAAAAGLRQPSLFHYFPTKEDLLAELLDRTVAPAVGFLEWLEHQDAPPEVRLCALAWRDVDNLCSGPHNLGALQLLPEARGERFAPFWTHRAELQRGYRRLVAACGAERPELATSLVFGLVESVITWYQRGGSLTSAEVADEVSLAALRLATGRGGAFSRQRAAAQRLVGAAPSTTHPPALRSDG